MSVRLFRHAGYESILEGEVIETGVGFVYKRRLERCSTSLASGAERAVRNHSDRIRRDLFRPTP